MCYHEKLIEIQLNSNPIKRSLFVQHHGLPEMLKAKEYLLKGCMWLCTLSCKKKMCSRSNKLLKTLLMTLWCHLAWVLTFKCHATLLTETGIDSSLQIPKEQFKTWSREKFVIWTYPLLVGSQNKLVNSAQVILTVKVSSGCLMASKTRPIWLPASLHEIKTSLCLQSISSSHRIADLETLSKTFWEKQFRTWGAVLHLANNLLMKSLTRNLLTHQKSAKFKSFF